MLNESSIVSKRNGVLSLTLLTSFDGFFNGFESSIRCFIRPGSLRQASDGAPHNIPNFHALTQYTTPRKEKRPKFDWILVSMSPRKKKYYITDMTLLYYLVSSTKLFII